MASEPLKKLLENVDDGRLVLPEFQRDFVWEPGAIIKLMVSICNGYPIGSLLLMENSGAYQSRLIQGVKPTPELPDAETVLVLDGQQRLTSCYQAFYGSISPTSNRFYFKLADFVKAAEQGTPPDGSSIVDLFEYVKAPRITRQLDTTAKEISAGLFPLDIILHERRGTNYSKWLNNYIFMTAKGVENRVEALSNYISLFQTNFIESVTGYQINYEKITRETNPDVICTIFETINTTGVKLTVFDLLVARCYKDNVRLRDKLADLLAQSPDLARLDPEGGEIATVQLPRIIGLLQNKSCKKGDVLRLTPAQIGDQWDRAVNGLNKAMRLLTTKLGARRLDFIATQDAIASLAAVCANPRFNEDRHLEKVSRWYWAVSFTGYFAISPDTKSERAYRDWTDATGFLADDGAEPEVFRDIGLSRLTLATARKGTSLYRGLMGLLTSRGLKDIGEHRLAFNDLNPDEIEDHHVFPKKLLSNHGIKGNEANAVLNRVPVSRQFNREVGSDAPNVYLGRSASDRLTDDDFAKIGLDRRLLESPFTIDGYRNYLADRKKRLQDIIVTAIGGKAKALFELGDE